MLRNNQNDLFLFAFMVLSNITLSVLLFIDKKTPEEYQYLYWLPLLYAFVIVLFWFIVPQKMLNNIGVLLFAVQSYIRCSITPLLMYLGNYQSLFRYLNKGYVLGGVLLLIYEQICCILVIAISAKYQIPSNSRTVVVISDKFSLAKSAEFIMFTSCILCVLLWIIEPSIRDNYDSIFSIIAKGEKFSGTDYTESLSQGQSGRMFTTLFLVLFKSVRILVPVYFIKQIKDAEKLSSLILAFGIAFLQFLFVSATIAECLISATLLILFVFKKFPKYRSLIISSLGVVGCVFVIAVLALSYETSKKWYGTGNVAEYASQTLQSYFTGPDNVASVFRVQNSNNIMVLLQTFVAAIPFQSAVFGNWASEYNLNNLYTSLPSLRGQIIATIAGGYYIFGPVFAPVFSAIFMRVSIKYGELYNNETNDWKSIAYLFMCIQFAIGLGAYNISITLSYWMQAGIPLLIVAFFSSAFENDFNR